jgi:hypothetical protein
MKRRPNLGLAILGGFVGTPAMTAAVYILATLIAVKMDIVDALATMLGGWSMGMLVLCSAKSPYAHEKVQLSQTTLT